MTQEGILYERLEKLERSCRGHLSTITRLRNEIDENLNDFSNVVKVRAEQSQLNEAWKQYCVCCDKYQRVLSDRAIQYSRIQTYNSKIEQFAISGASFYNVQVSENVKVSKKISPTNSVHSFSSQTSKLSISSSKAQRAKIQAVNAALIQQQAEESSRREVELEVKRVEMEVKHTEMELKHRLELTKLEAESKVSAAKNQAELAKLEALVAEQEVSDLPSCEKGAKWPHNHAMNEIQPPEVPSVILPSVTTASSNLDIGPRGNPPLTSMPATENPLTTSSNPPIAKIRFRVPHVTSKELTELAVNVQSEKVPSPNIP